MNTIKRQHNKLIVITTSASVLALGLVTNTMAAPGALATSPLFLQSGSVQPNIFFMIDDSGSMDWEHLPSNGARNSTTHPSPISSGNLDFTPDDHAEQMALCPGFNVMAYNPAVTYTPWWGKDNAGAAFVDQALKTALANPYLSGGTMTDLSDHYYMVWNDANGDGEFDSDPNGDGDPSDGECPVVSVNHGAVDTVAECDALGLSICVPVSKGDKTNYANWYSYYRKREYVAKRALSQIISESTARAGLATINGQNANSLTGSSNDIFSLISDIDDITTPVDGTAALNKDKLLESLFRINSRNGTPLRRALERVGRYYDSSDSIWNNEPILSAAKGGECQQNFTVLMSDGTWNGGDPGVGNTDEDGPGPFDGGDYADTFSNTLADVAMHYYETDLSTLANRVPTQLDVDENDAQHMVTYTVAFGLNGTLLPDELPGEINFSGWGIQPVSNSPETIDDMRHAAFNGRGQYLSAKNPQDLIKSLGATISDIDKRTGSAAAVSFNSTSLQSGTRIFQAEFDPERWAGDLIARTITINTTTGVATVSGAAWNAKTDIDGRTPASRQLITYNGTSGINFEWNSLTNAQKNDLRTDGSGSFDTEASGMARLGYLRGERICETSDSGPCRYPTSGNDVDGKFFDTQILRNRKSALGDIIHSSPFFVGPPATAYPDSIEPSAPYSAFAIANSTRAGMTYVGSNDGMLHAFDESGTEVFGYIPESLFSTGAGEGLHYLTDPTYIHRYYVDLSPTVQDVYIDVSGGSSPQWLSVLVGGLRGGGKGLFAIDVTDPSALVTSAASKVLWEYTNPDLGYTFSDIRIGKMNNISGDWAAIFGNGYNSDPNGDGKAKLFIVPLDGSAATVLDTGAGSMVSNDCGNPSSDCNGLGTPKLVDLNGDGTVDRIYAGDLFGNLWAFDVSGTSGWASAYAPNPLFRACATTPCLSSNRQPITVAPDVTFHPTESSYSTTPNLLVFFGTGQYLTQSDNANKSQQSFYGVWDSDVGNLDRDSLVSQSITTTNDVVLGDVRTITENPVAYSNTVKGWLIDFPTVNGLPSGALSGERAVANPSAFGSIVFFNTVIPEASSSDMCSAGGTGWLMAVNLLTGGQPGFVPIDVDNNGVFDANDKLGSLIVVGTKTGDTQGGGVPSESRFISNKRVTAGSKGGVQIDNVQTGPPSLPSRMSWSELDAPF